ncbi:MAG: sulfite exporter TauE/SafE family protein [bacterium]|nr:sulfite exporter TauE/SafE family protein [bacterium]
MTAQLILLLVAGFATGFINAVAGGGSALTIPLLTLMFDANIANGTNRVPVLFANIASIVGYHRGGSVPWKRVRVLLAPVLVGAGVGAWVATGISAEGMQRVFAVVLLGVAASAIINTKQWLEEIPTRLGPVGRVVVFFLIGFYGGFAQIGVGILLLTALVLGSGFDLLKGNGAKVVIIAVYSLITLPFYFWAGQVNLGLGVVLAFGFSAGAYLASRMVVRKGAGWAKWVLVVASVVAAIRMMFV